VAQSTSDFRTPRVTGVTRCRKKDGKAITVPRLRGALTGWLSIWNCSSQPS